MRGIKLPLQERPRTLGTALRPVGFCSLSLHKALLQLFIFGAFVLHHKNTDLISLSMLVFV
jgi:hypothetical protein